MPRRKTVLSAPTGPVADPLTIDTGAATDPASIAVLEPKNGKGKALTIKQEAYVASLTTPGSPTFGNKTRSAMVAGYGNGDPERAGDIVQSASLRVPIVQDAIHAALTKHGLTLDDRAIVLHDILHNPIETTSQYDKDSKFSGKTIRHSRDIQLKTIRLLNNMDGTSAKSNALGAAAGRALAPLLREQLARMRAALASEGTQYGPGEAIDPSPSVSVESESACVVEPAAGPTGECAEEHTS